ncbi:hypothetical protein LX32DRAFT_143295 [Colletotrichum zoysiae]|uniref:Uncharacterized protein n=1 Tax=Colletotrichum zoysiae TaxID=1216348 RepID=A0AAD9H8S1_9PEZI|nr:hypothetical protein LX32DRAFT_143295 [Colletotrichum zoysiae]
MRYLISPNLSLPNKTKTPWSPHLVISGQLHSRRDRSCNRLTNEQLSLAEDTCGFQVFVPRMYEGRKEGRKGPLLACFACMHRRVSDSRRLFVFFFLPFSLQNHPFRLESPPTRNTQPRHADTKGSIGLSVCLFVRPIRCSSFTISLSNQPNLRHR